MTDAPVRRAMYLDPSINCAGWARFDDGVLVGAGAVSPTSSGWLRLVSLRVLLPARSPIPTHIVFEEPILRTRGAGPACKPADLVKLAAAAGALVASEAGTLSDHLRWGVPRVDAVTPLDWKGNLPKEATHNHMWRVLSEKENLTLRDMTVGLRADEVHNVYDAVCIGLYCEGRAPWKRLKSQTSASTKPRVSRSTRTSKASKTATPKARRRSSPSRKTSPTSSMKSRRPR